MKFFSIHDILSIFFHIDILHQESLFYFPWRPEKQCLSR